MKKPDAIGGAFPWDGAFNSNLQAHRVLVAGRDRAWAKGLAAALKERGHSVRCVRPGRGALQATQSHRPGLGVYA